MLREHLSQDHDAASRRTARIDAQVDWLHERWLSSGASRVLDLGCGPGLYTHHLARLGHSCVGVDFSPASIAHARGHADAEALDCRYLEENLLTMNPGDGFDLALLLFGELNTFPAEEAERILRRASRALAPSGRIVLEVHTPDHIRGLGQAAPLWFTAKSGLFSDSPYLALRDAAWSEEQRAAVERFLVIDLASGGVSEFASTSQAYSLEDLGEMLLAAGFDEPETFPSLTGVREQEADGLMVLSAALLPR